jgi:nitroreductase
MNTDNPLLKHLLTRRSTKIPALKEPGPTAEQLDLIFTSATRVPDHKRTLPWRFVVLEGDARARFGKVLADIVTRESAEPPSPMRIETERQRPMRAPVVVALIFRHTPTPGAPELEQLMSCGAAGMNLVHAANALGFGTNWVTEWPAFSPGVRAALGLAENEKIAGFVYIGTPGEQQEERERPALADVVTRWEG